MKEKIKSTLLNKIEYEWHLLTAQYQPWGVWIRYCAPVPEEFEYGLGYSIFPLQAWFLDEKAVSERSIWEFQRFIFVHSEQPWCGKICKELSIWGGTRHEIGLASFAQYENSLDYYLEWSWGGRNGRGWKVKFNDNGDNISYKSLWCS